MKSGVLDWEESMVAVRGKGREEAVSGGESWSRSGEGMDRKRSAGEIVLIVMGNGRGGEAPFETEGYEDKK